MGNMSLNSTKRFIFEGCNQLFPKLESGLKSSKETNEQFRSVCVCDKEHDLVLQNEIVELTKGQFGVRLFIEFELNGDIRRHPEFFILMDYATKRADVLSFSSNLYPKIRLKTYYNKDGKKHTNLVAENDLHYLCLTWIKQLIEMNYKPKWEQ